MYLTLLFLSKLNRCIQEHFDYACSTWYVNLNMKLVKKVQIIQNKCISFCVNMENRAHIGIEEFKKINWLPTRERFEQCVCVGTYKFCNNIAPAYMTDIYTKNSNNQYSTHEGMHRMNLPSRNIDIIHKGLTYIGHSLWNSLSPHIKSSETWNSFKHKIKEDLFQNFEEKG